MSELWDVYDRNRNLTGRVIERGTLMTEEEYHLVVQVWIKNTDGKWLISRRTATKSEPLKWEPTGGSVVAGEDSLSGALREVREELGIVLEKENGKVFRSFRRDKACWENPGFLDVWVFESDVQLEDVVLQEEEVCDVKWATCEEIVQMIECDEFVPMKKFPYYIELFSEM